MPVILDTQEAEIRRVAVWSQPGQTVHGTLYQKYPTQKRASEVIEGVECLPSKCEVLSSNPEQPKKNPIECPQNHLIKLFAKLYARKKIWMSKYSVF
jgi:hypothetical protein